MKTAHQLLRSGAGVLAGLTLLSSASVAAAAGWDTPILHTARHQGMGGTAIFRVKVDDPNVSVILETLTEHGTRTIMAQRYIPEIVDGDKRILMIGGEPVPYCLARVPLAGETRGNLRGGRSRLASPSKAK